MIASAVSLLKAKKNISSEQIAIKMGCSKLTVDAIEKGILIPSDQEITALAAAFGMYRVDFDFLLRKLKEM